MGIAAECLEGKRLGCQHIRVRIAAEVCVAGSGIDRIPEESGSQKKRPCHTSNGDPEFSTQVTLPFFKNVSPDLGFGYIFFAQRVLFCYGLISAGL